MPVTDTLEDVNDELQIHFWIFIYIFLFAYFIGVFNV